MDEFDAYIVHASEDIVLAAAISEGLRSSGLRTWFNAFVPGYPLRAQMEDGLRNATCGVVLITKHTAAKKWVREEIDTLYGMESGIDESRIVPVWSGVDAETVRAASPMLSMRSAIIHKGSMSALVAEVRSAVMFRFKTRGQWLRSSLLEGLDWMQGPGFFPESFDIFDSDEAYWLTELKRARSFRTAATAEQMATVRPLIDVVRGPEGYAGKLVTCIGHQAGGTQQVLTLHGSDPDDAEPPAASYVFQLTSNEFTGNMTVYVHGVGPYFEGGGPWNRENELCVVSGLVMAYGAVRSTHGHYLQTIYLAAKCILLTPPAIRFRLSNAVRQRLHDIVRL